MSKGRKTDKFNKLAEARVTKALKMISLIGNLSNRNSYFYTENEVKKIIQSLKFEVDQIEKRFKLQLRADEGKEREFKL